VLVGQLVDNARLVRREWGEDDTDGNIFSRSMCVCMCMCVCVCVCVLCVRM